MSILDLWVARRFPEKWGPEAQAQAKEIIEKMRIEKGLPPLSDKEGWDRLQRKSDEYWNDVIEKQYDTSILKLFGLDLNSFRKMRHESGHQSRAATHTTKLTTKFMELAVESFLKAEAQGLSFTESWRLAKQEIAVECGRTPADTTLKNWLKEIATPPLSTIPPSPGKGRPKA